MIKRAAAVLNEFDGKMYGCCQEIIYLAQQLGIHVGFHFGWYRSPYSKRLSWDLDHLPNPTVKADVRSRMKIEKYLKPLLDNREKHLSLVDWARTLSMVVFLAKNESEDLEEIIHMFRANGNFIDRDIITQARDRWDEQIKLMQLAVVRRPRAVI